MPEPSGPLSIILIVVFLILSAFFAGSESAFSYCDRYRIEVWADDGIKRAKLALKVIEKFDDTIITILVATNVLHVATSIIATILFVNTFGLGEIGSVLSTIIITILVFLFSEVLPKNIAQANSDKWAINSSFFIIFFYIILFPVVLLFNLLIKLIKKIFSVKETNHDFDEQDFHDEVEKKSIWLKKLGPFQVISSELGGK